jgi:hypothetical protein
VLQAAMYAVMAIEQTKCLDNADPGDDMLWHFICEVMTAYNGNP